MFPRFRRPPALLLVSLFFANLLAQADDSAPVLTYRSNSSEVRVMFFSTDAKNRAVGTITADDFVVIDGDVVVRDFRSLVRTDETRLDVVILIDASESMAKDFSLVIDEVLALIWQREIAGDDKLAVIAFGGSDPTTICSGDCRTLEAHERILSLKPAGSTPLFDAVVEAGDWLGRHNVPEVRPVVILFSDGKDTISKASWSDALYAVVNIGTLVYGVDLGADDGPGGRADLRRMVEATGGRTFSIAEGAAEVMRSVLADLQNSYVVTYRLPTSGVGFHPLRILPKHDPNLRFHCRSGYYFGENQ